MFCGTKRGTGWYKVFFFRAFLCVDVVQKWYIFLHYQVQCKKVLSGYVSVKQGSLLGTFLSLLISWLVRGKGVIRVWVRKYPVGGYKTRVWGDYLRLW